MAPPPLSCFIHLYIMSLFPSPAGRHHPDFESKRILKDVLAITVQLHITLPLWTVTL